MDSVAAPCPCWTDVSCLVLADVKALFAHTDPELTVVNYHRRRK